MSLLFIYADVICQHGLPRSVVMDGRSENLGLTKRLLEGYCVKNIHISAYHPQSDGLVERGHSAVLNGFLKYGRTQRSDRLKFECFQGFDLEPEFCLLSIVFSYDHLISVNF